MRLVILDTESGEVSSVEHPATVPTADNITEALAQAIEVPARLNAMPNMRPVYVQSCTGIPGQPGILVFHGLFQTRMRNPYGFSGIAYPAR